MSHAQETFADHINDSITSCDCEKAVVLSNQHKTTLENMGYTVFPGLADFDDGIFIVFEPHFKKSAQIFNVFRLGNGRVLHVVTPLFLVQGYLNRSYSIFFFL